MAERGADEVEAAGRGPSVLLLVAGLAALGVGVGVGFGLAPAVVRVVVNSPVDPRWIVVAITLLVGSALLVGGLRRR